MAEPTAGLLLTSKRWQYWWTFVLWSLLFASPLVCRADDHGNTPQTATQVGIGGVTAGLLEVGGDADYFKITVATAATYVIYTRGNTNTDGRLYDASYTHLDWSYAGGENGNFKMVKVLTPGVYYVAVSGSVSGTVGAYQLHVEGPGAGTISDDHGSSPWSATPVAIGSITQSNLGLNDTDYFRITVATAATYVIYTRGNTNTDGRLYDASYTFLVWSYAGGENENFKMVKVLTPGVYYVAVSGGVSGEVGAYQLVVDGPDACTTGGTVSGNVIDAATGQRLAGVNLNIEAATTTSAANGSFNFPTISAGRHFLISSALNFSGGGSPINVCGNTLANVLLTRNQTVFGASAASGYAADPVNTATGNYTFTRTDFQLPGKGVGFSFERGYNSQDPRNGPLGFGWTHHYNISLEIDGSGNITVRDGDGHTAAFAPNGSGGYVSQYGVFDTLVKESDASYTLTKKDLRVYRFSAALKLLSIADRNGNTIALTYTGSLLTRVTDTAGRNVDFTYDGSGRITQLSVPLGRTLRFAYDGAGNLASSTDPASKVTTYTYDANHQMLTATDPRDNVFVTNIYDAVQRVVTSQRDAKGGQTSYEYDPVARQTTIRDPLGQITVHTHDNLLRLISDRNPLGHSRLFTYDPAGNRSSVTDRNGNLTAYAYDGAGNVTRKTDALAKVTTLTYDSRNNPLTRIDAMGYVTRFTYDARGNLTATTDALGHIVRSNYDSAGLPLTLTDARNNVTTNTYDTQGNLTQVRDALGNNTRLTYDAAGRRLTRIDALGRITMYAYDADDNLVSVTDPAGKTIIYTYDGNNNRISTTDKLGRITRIAYDQKDLPSVLTDALGAVITNTYDSLDRKIATTDKRGKVTQFAYGAAGRLIRVTDALGNQTQYAYDAHGNRIAVTDALGHRSSFSYDPLNRLIQVTDVAGGIVTYGYDADGNRISMTDPRGKLTSYAYDALHRLITKTEPGGYVTRVAYDAAGNRSRITKPNGTIVQYAYDPLDRLTSLTYPDASHVDFTYDVIGNRKTMTDGMGSTTYAYDGLDRLTSVVNSFGKTVGYAYDAASNLTTLTYPDGKQVNYVYDALNRLTRLTDWASRSTGYTYDLAGRLTGSNLANGAQATYGYDDADRLTALTHQARAQTFASYAYTLDAIGNQTAVNATEPIAPVIAAGTHSYSYDVDNRLTQINAIAQTFDSNGNLTAKGSDSFAWDFEDRLLQSSVAGNVNSYRYDGTGNRLSRAAAGSTTRFVLDLNGPLSRVLAETNTAGTISAWYVYGLGLVERVAADGSVRFYHHDSRGSTVALSDSAGNLTDRYAYDPFGQVANAAGATPNPFKYVGRFGLFDEANGLIYIRARYYNPGQGRFLSKDPKPGNETDTQSLHRFVYAMNNPIRMVDINGLSAREGAPATNRDGPSDMAHSQPQDWCSFVPEYFPKSCEQHDPCYGDAIKSKTQCDDEFFAAMIKENPDERYKADIYRLGVRKFGVFFYGDSPLPASATAFTLNLILSVKTYGLVDDLVTGKHIEDTVKQPGQWLGNKWYDVCHASWCSLGTF